MAIKIGLYGVFRGSQLVGAIRDSGAQIVAVCDRRKQAIQYSKESHPEMKDAVEYTDFEEFIKHDMDAVLLANFFHEHAKCAIRAMEEGKHVLSECLSNVTMADGVALCRAVERTGKIYALLENYPFIKENLEMERLYKEGTLGKIVYAEGEYIHAMSSGEHNFYARGPRHWRNWTPRSYYLSHALAPIMKMTDALPTKVTAMAAFAPETVKNTAMQSGDAACIVMCQTDKDAVFRVIGWGNYAPHGSYYKLCCTKGGAEINHGNGKMRLCYNSWTRPEGVEQDTTEYDVQWPDQELGEIAKKHGHGGGDFLVVHDFIKCLEEGREPYWNVYRSTAIASVAILAWRSVLNNNMAYDVPDFRKEEDKLRYEQDSITPFPDEDYRVTIPCSSKPYAPSEEDLAAAEEMWKSYDMLVR